jgi:endonuclease/exonuclease/phosphatase (EEP) superfamily protein YafD
MTSTRLLGLVSCLLAHAAWAADDDLHVMAFNVLFQGADDAKSVQAIEDEDPDVVCLTELTPAFVKTFETSLGKRYPHRQFAPKSGTWGVGFASKRPLRQVTTYPVPPVKIPAMEATVAAGGRDVRLVCVHLVPPAGKHQKSDSFFTTLEKNAAVRAKQADTLIARFAKAPGPVVLLGDFNEEPGGDALKKLEQAGWVRGCRSADTGCAATFPGPASPWPPVFEIDHVFARGAVFSAAKTVHGGGSDHYPVSATLRPAASE